MCVSVSMCLCAHVHVCSSVCVCEGGGDRKQRGGHKGPPDLPNPVSRAFPSSGKRLTVLRVFQELLSPLSMHRLICGNRGLL